MFYVLKIKGYRFQGRLFPFKRVGNLNVTLYEIMRNEYNATEEAKKYKNYCESVEITKTCVITKKIFLRQMSSCGIFKGCQAKIEHTCKDDYPIHLWYDPASEGVGFFCEDAIIAMAKRYPYNEISTNKGMTTQIEASLGITVPSLIQANKKDLAVLLATVEQEKKRKSELEGAIKEIKYNVAQSLDEMYQKVVKNNQ